MSSISDESMSSAAPADEPQNRFQLSTNSLGRGKRREGRGRVAEFSENLQTGKQVKPSTLCHYDTGPVPLRDEAVAIRVRHGDNVVEGLLRHILAERLADAIGRDEPG